VLVISQRLKLVPDRWYGWQMIPGYAGERNVPYFSPIRVSRVTPKKSGKTSEVLGLLQRFAVEPWRTGDVDILDDLVTEDYTLQGGSGGLNDLSSAIRDTQAGLPDAAVTVSDVIVQGDRVAYRWTMSGTHEGEYEGISSTGKPSGW
jgi:hypothetical protein